MRPKIVAEISSKHLCTLLICMADEIGDYHQKDETELTLDDALEFFESRKEETFLVREWQEV